MLAIIASEVKSNALGTPTMKNPIPVKSPVMIPTIILPKITEKVTWRDFVMNLLVTLLLKGSESRINWIILSPSLNP